MVIAGRGKTGYDQIRDEASKRCKILFYTLEGNSSGTMAAPPRVLAAASFRSNEGWFLVHICGQHWRVRKVAEVGWPPRNGLDQVALHRPPRQTRQTEAPLDPVLAPPSTSQPSSQLLASSVLAASTRSRVPRSLASRRSTRCECACGFACIPGERGTRATGIERHGGRAGAFQRSLALDCG